MPKFSELSFDHSYASLPEIFYHRVKPEPLHKPHLIDFNPEVANLIGLCHSEERSTEFLSFMAGHPVPGTKNIAAVYAGYQFGHYVPQLGDGRAVLLTEVVNPNGSRWDIQLKGAGLTAFSRQGDGRAVLRSTIREYLCSEAMAGLNIPTTRALCLVGSETQVYRESIETGAMLTRVAPSHVRFGTFEYFYHSKQQEMVKVLADYLLQHHFSDIEKNETCYATMFHRIVTSTAELIAQWQTVGFAHGVMNTDNMSVLGLTIDYGPFGFLDNYNPDFICNHSDYHGRYAFKEQPDIALWNLSCLAQALTPLVDVEQLKESLAHFNPMFSQTYADLMLKKFGLKNRTQENANIMQQVFPLLEKNNVDYTIFFRQLSHLSREQNKLRDMFVDREAFDQWANDFLSIVQSEKADPAQRKADMDNANPKFILRNYLAQQAIEKAQAGDFSEIKLLREILSHPFSEQSEYDDYAQLPPDWASEIAVSCSS